MNTGSLAARILPYFIGTLVIAILASLGLWQITRGLEKRASLDAYDADDSFAAYAAGMEPRPFQMLKVNGEYLGEQQILLDNMVANGRSGHFVITPFRLATGTLLVNRGWIANDSPAQLRERLEVSSAPILIRGRVGQLPRAGMRMGGAFEGSSGWPRHAVYPTQDEVADLLGTSLKPFVLLLDEGEQFGFQREWEPEEMSASRHFGYAFQWFAMATVLSGLLVLQYRKRKKA